MSRTTKKKAVSRFRYISRSTQQLYCMNFNLDEPERLCIACSRLSVSGGLKKRGGDEWGLVGKKERSGEPVSIVLKTSFRYTSSWYTLWLVTFDSLYQHLVCLSEAKWRLTGRTWYTRVISSSPNLLKRSEWSKERVWSIWPLDRCFCHS